MKMEGYYNKAIEDTVPEVALKSREPPPPKKYVVTASEAFATILESAGNFGKWQWRLMIMCSFCGIYTGLHNFAGVFLGADPTHWCNIPNYNVSASDAKEMQNETTPWIRGNDGNMVPSSCLYYEDIPHDYSNITVQCDSWFYDRSEYHSTIVTEWNVVCDRKYMVSAAQSIFMMGILTGAVLFSALSDRWGRRKVCLLSVVIFIASSMMVIWSTSLTMFITLRFIVAASGQGMFLINYVLLMECLGMKGRTILGNLFHTGFTIGFTLLALIGYYFRDWRHLQMAIAVPSFLLLVYFVILPESPRWLMTQSRYDEALKILESIAKTNGRKLPEKNTLDELMLVIQKEGDKPTENASMIQKLQDTWEAVVILVRTPNMRRRNLITFYSWFVVSMMYYGLTFNGANLDASAHLNVFLSGAVEAPAIAFTIISVFWLGRRPILCGTMTLSGIACVAIAFVPKSLVGWNVTLSTIGKCLSSSAFYLVFVFSAELVPTNVRNMSLGISSLWGRLGSAISPFVVDLLGDVYYAAPSTIFGITAIVAGLLALLLPETGNKKLPESVNEIEAMDR